MREQDRDQEEEKKIKLKLQCFIFHLQLPWVSQTPHSLRSQPVIFSQHILKLSRKIAIFYKTHNPIIFSDHTPSRICEQTKNKQQQQQKPSQPALCFQKPNLWEARGGNGYIWNLYFPEAGQTVACPSLQRGQRAPTSTTRAPDGAPSFIGRRSRSRCHRRNTTASDT